MNYVMTTLSRNWLLFLCIGGIGIVLFLIMILGHTIYRAIKKLECKKCNHFGKETNFCVGVISGVIKKKNHGCPYFVKKNT